MPVRVACCQSNVLRRLCKQAVAEIERALIDRYFEMSKSVLCGFYTNICYKLESEIRFSELLASNRPLGIACEGQQYGASFGKPSNCHRPRAVFRSWEE